jgi:hypothetical protein
MVFVHLNFKKNVPLNCRLAMSWRWGYSLVISPPSVWGSVNHPWVYNKWGHKWGLLWPEVTENLKTGEYKFLLNSHMWSHSSILAAGAEVQFTCSELQMDEVIFPSFLWELGQWAINNQQWRKKHAKLSVPSTLVMCNKSKAVFQAPFLIRP